MFDQLVASCAAARTLGERVRACAQLENAACAARLQYMVEMLAAAYHADGSTDREQWRIDNWSAVSAAIGAAHQVTTYVASELLMDAVTLAERLPKVGALFAEGLIAYRLVHTICDRTKLVEDPAVMRSLDADIANEVCTRGAMTVEQSKRDIDALVLRYDPQAVRRVQSSTRGQHVDVITNDASGTSTLTGQLSAIDGKAVNERADLLARTVCEHDPRTHEQRRASAFGAMGFGSDRLPCMCERPDCDAAAKPPVGGVVVHVIARADVIEAAEGGAPDGDGVPSGPLPQSDREPESDPELDREADTLREPESEADREPPPDSPPAAPVGDLAAQRRSLSGSGSPLLPKPWYSYSLSELCKALHSDPGEFCPVGPAVILGGPVLPASVAAQAAIYATVRPLVHPGQSPPEPRYRPSNKLAEFVRARDLICRFPGCTRPATVADLDHTIPWPYGPTCASNLKCLCREHHLLKTFWPGWSDRQLPDGTVIWRDPEGNSFTTYPGSRLLFPELATPTAEVDPAANPPTKHTAGLTMPRRKTTRAKERRQRVADERRLNLETEKMPETGYADSSFASLRRLPVDDDDPPPF